MNCLEFKETGPPRDVIHLAQRDVPSPGPGEVLVRMLASPVNPSDTMFIEGKYGVQPQLPQVPGFEGVGVVEGSGGGLRGRFFQGKRVAVLNKSGGNWADCAAVPAAQVIPVSARLTTEQAATFFVNPATAWIMTREVLSVPAGSWLLQTAAGSSLGKMIIRLGNALGFRTLNIVRSERHVDLLKTLGADEVVVFDPARHEEGEFQGAVQRIVGDGKVKYAIDCVGGMTGSAIVRSLSPGGRLLVFGTLDDAPLQFSSRTLMANGTTVEGFWLGNFMAQKSLPFKLRLVRKLTKLVLNGTLESDIAGSFSLADYSQALDLAYDRGSEGKTLLRMEQR